MKAEKALLERRLPRCCQPALATATMSLAEHAMVIRQGS